MGEEIVGKVKLKADSSDAEAAAKRTEAAFNKAIWTSRDNAKLAMFDFQKGFAVAMAEAKARWEPARLGALAFNSAIGAGVAALAAFGMALKEGIAISLERMRVEDLLRQSLANQDIVGGEVLGTLKALADATEELTGFESEEVQQGMALALNLGARTDQMAAMTQAAARLARVTGTDYQSAMEALARSLEGQGMQLGRLLPQLKDMTEEEFRQGGAINFVNKELEHSLKMTDDMRGSMNNLGNAFEDVLAKLGDQVTKSETLIGGMNLLSLVLDNADKAALALKWTMLALPAALLEVKRAAKGVGGALGGKLVDLLFEGTEIGAPELFGAPPVVGGRTPESTKTVNLLGAPGAAGYRSAKKGKEKKAPAMRDISGGSFNDEEAYWAEVEEMRQADAERYAADIERRVDLARAWAEERLSLEQRVADGIKGLADDRVAYLADLEDKATAYAIAKDEERAESQKWLMDTMLGAAESFTTAGVGLLMDLASATGEEQAAILKSFLSSTGEQMIGSGIRYGFEGLGKVLSSEGMSPTGYAMIGLGAAMTAGGAAMMAGSTAIQLPSSGTGAPGATATGGASPGNTTAPSAQAAPQQTTVIIYGEPSARLGVLIRDSLNQANNRGV